MTIKLFRRILFAHLAITMLALFGSVSVVHASDASSSVGKVTLSIGTSEVNREGRSEPLLKGHDIVPGDIIRTTASGHVHIRFVDGALVSIRPESVLHVEEYRFDPSRPADSLVKFYLETGTVRGISGQAAQMAKEKFRLNTPLVAIGVRGTDFITQASAQSAVVLVNQGAIVLTPLDDACRANSFGPCQTARSRELAGSMNGMALVYRQSTPEPVLQPVNSLKGVDRVTPILLQEHLGNANTNVTNVVADSKNPETVLDVLATRNTLVWGRWAHTPIPGDNLTVPFVEALTGNKVTIGDGYYFLFRNENAPNLIDSASGVTNFHLQGGSAYYRAASNVLSEATITGGALGIDFTHNTFSTQLAVTAPSVGSQSLTSRGTIDRNTGIFLSSNGADSRVAGAVSLNIAQAGFFFSKPVNGGVLSGATLWGR